MHFMLQSKINLLVLKNQGILKCPILFLKKSDLVKGNQEAIVSHISCFHQINA